MVMVVVITIQNRKKHKQMEAYYYTIFYKSQDLLIFNSHLVS